MYGLVVRFELRDGHEAAFDRLTAQTVGQIEAHEPGTLLYVTHQVAGAPHFRVFYELYRDEAAFEEHEGQPYVRRFLEYRDEHLVGPPEVTAVHPGSGVARNEVQFGDP
jgi:quinol monooxygenase YgiN